MYLRGTEDTDAVRWHFFAHAALDIVEERGELLLTASQSNPFLGLLTTLEDTVMYD